MRLKLAPKLALGMFIGPESTALEKEAALQEWTFEREANLTALAISPFLLEEVANFLETEADSTSARDRLIRGLAANTGCSLFKHFSFSRLSMIFMSERPISKSPAVSL